MIQKIYIVVASGGEREDYWTNNVSASFDKVEAEAEVERLQDLNQKLIAVHVEVHNEFTAWHERNPRPAFVQQTHNTIRAVSNYTELFTDWLTTWYPNYVTIMENHGLVPTTYEIVNWAKIQGSGYESTDYEVEEVTMLTNMKEMK